jgi:nicotinate phosphoribosyltransferase
MSPHGESALVTDLYEITMLQAYFLHRMNETAVFEFFVRQLSGARDFLLAAGLEQVVAYLTDLHFGKEDLQRLRGSRRFNPSFIRTLEDFRFTGEVDAWLKAEEGAQIKVVRTDRV